MNATFKKVLSIILVAIFVLSLSGAVLAETDNVIDTEEEIQAAIDAIPAGGKGEVTIENINLGLANCFYVDSKDVTFNLKNAQISTTAECCPVIVALDANITINADNQSSLTTNSNTFGMGTIRLDNGLWDDEAKKYTKTFNLTINGGKYFSPAEDAIVYATPGTIVTLSNVMCDGIVDAINMETVGVPEYGKLVINSGVFTNDIKKYAADGKFACNVGHKYYVRDKETSDEFAKLVPGNKITFDYAPPKSTEDEALFLLCETLWEQNPDLYFDPMSFSSDFKTCEIGINMDTPWEEVHAVQVVWNYDQKVLETAKTYIDKFPTDRNWFAVSDLELVNYFANYNPDAENDSFANYSGELKKIFNNANFTLEVETRGGGAAPYYTETIGSAKLMHDGKVYFTAGMLGARGEHTIFVPKDTASTKDALLAAAQKRVDDYIGAGKIKLTATNYTTTAFYNDELARYDAELADARARLNAEMAKPENERDMFVVFDCRSIIDYTPIYKQNFIDSFKDGGDHAFLNKAEGGFIFTADVVGKEVAFDFIIVKDDAKMVVPSFATADLDTNVSVTTTSSSVPLDTVAKVEKLTEGTDFDRITKALDGMQCEIFDINLHSASANKNITKLEDGEFYVTLPIPDEYVNKALTVYYVDDNGKPVEHPPVAVDLEKKFITFETNHFSIYTLAVKGDAGDADVDGAIPAPEVPKTGDSNAIYLFISVLVLGALGILASRKISKER